MPRDTHSDHLDSRHAPASFPSADFFREAPRVPQSLRYSIHQALLSARDTRNPRVAGDAFLDEPVGIDSSVRTCEARVPPTEPAPCAR